MAKNKKTLTDLPSDIKQQVEKGVSILEQGGIVAFPTDTVYGLGAGAYLTKAVDRIYQVKQRPRNMALPILLANTSQLAEVTESLPPVARLLAEHFLPGALTLVLRKAKSIPDIVSAGSDTIAVRVPAHPIPVALVSGIGMPIVGTSANISSRPSAVTAQEVVRQFGNTIDLVIDGGRCPGIESTIVDVTGSVPVILREGAISRQELQKICESIK
ncbi:MAG: L-threonylcarbamoyladenylate synthase [Dehalococcoidales bacterium]|nr:L-threonylcarbamoyladenylate synthase [Dehalococcoidales bacterium]